jgi:hypothetical protein
MGEDLPGTSTGEGEKSARPKRQYPPFYEKAVPIALVVIVIAIVILLLIILGVALELFPGVG